MKANHSSRAWRTRSIVLLLTLLAPCPYSAHAEDAAEPPTADTDPADTDPADAEPAALTPPSLLPELDLALPALPPGSAPESVVLELTVEVDGTASDAVVLSSAGAERDREALAAVARLRFQPALRGTESIVARIPFRFTFQPRDEPAPVAPKAATEPSAPRAPEVEGITLDVQGDRPQRETTVHAVVLKETQRIAGTNGDPLRAIENLPGVARPPGLQAQLVVRGSAPGDTGVFIDGIDVPFAYHFGGVSSVVPAEALTKLDFRPGNFGAEYGRYMGGIVELSLRSPRRDRLGGLVQLDNFDGRFVVEGPLSPRTRFMLSARRSWVDAWIGKVDDSITAAPVYYDGQAILEHDLTARTTVRLIFLAADDRMKLMFAAPSASDPAEGGGLEFNTRFTRLALRIDSQLSEQVELRQSLWWGSDSFAFRGGAELQDIHAHTLGARGELRAKLGHWATAAIGVDASFQLYDVRLRVPPYPPNDEVDSPAFARPLRTFDERVWMIRPALYALLELTPSEGVRIIPSVRADYVHDTAQLVVDPRISMLADVHSGFPRTTLKGAVGFYSQPPLGVESVEPFGTKGLESNRSVHVSTGLEQELAPGLVLSLEGFYKHLTNLVVARTAEDDDGVGARFDNRGSGRAYGAETLLRYRSDDGRYFGWLAYTLSRSERRDAPGEPYHLFQWDQTHILTALGNVELGRGYSLGARFRYVTGSPYTPYVGAVLDLDAGAYAPVGGRSYSERLPSFQQLDLRFDKSWQLGPTKLIAYFELRNSYNRKNAEQLAYNFDYSETKPVRGLPILPIIGLRGEL